MLRQPARRPLKQRLLALRVARAPHLVVESAGSGGRHAYWRLAAPLAATAGPADGLGWLTGPDGDERPIELAHERLIYAPGYRWERGRPVPTVADGQCRDRSRVMRLSEIGERQERALRADRVGRLALPAWELEALVGDLAPAPRPRARPAKSTVAGTTDDPYKRIPPAVLPGVRGTRARRYEAVLDTTPSHRAAGGRSDRRCEPQAAARWLIRWILAPAGLRLAGLSRRSRRRGLIAARSPTRSPQPTGSTTRTTGPTSWVPLSPFCSSGQIAEAVAAAYGSCDEDMSLTPLAAGSPSGLPSGANCGQNADH